MVRDHKDDKEKKKDEDKDTEEKKEDPKSKTRKRRRDAGRSKQSRLSKLACLQLKDKAEEDAVRDRQPLALEKVTQSLEADPVEELLAQTLQDEEEVA